MTKRETEDIATEDHLLSIDVRRKFVIVAQLVVSRCSNRLLVDIVCVFNLSQVKLCNGKLVHIEGCRRGFYSIGKQRIICHNLVDLLRQISRAFDNVSLVLAVLCMIYLSKR